MFEKLSVRKKENRVKSVSRVQEDGGPKVEEDCGGGRAASFSANGMKQNVKRVP